ncbi:cation:proton antiporter [Parapedobacter indicus]|uniref:Transporter, CPA2 family n=1 Tax=Parapedobacter indicus TaxID=1477437 RepID=A0A1I3H6M4_9SPHI|nr:cation:proton antiporter [Parapedobacter indicus]PPL02915.1 transporter (CPA2 family) [Parapedobacter indicus]SFI31321.1 transporter, CPA2 family [Parapedobacter indicus]
MKLKNWLFYLCVIGGFSGLGYWIISRGRLLENGSEMPEHVMSESGWQHFQASIGANLAYPLAILLLQIIAIILVARVFGMLFRKIGQPSVIGETVAGIVLGPSVLGLYFPEFSAFLFPVSSLPNLGVLSQIGLILFMFVVGMELDLKLLRKQAHDAVIISHASIIFPFALGMGLAYFIYQQTAPPQVPFLSYALFIGISMSITAFPVLARIVQERGITKTKLGSIVITCAAADDITAWCLLAAVIAVVKAGSLASAGFTLFFAILYVILMLRFVGPFIQRIGELHSTKERLSKPVVGLFFMTLLLSAWVTEVIGIHALFGAFMAGVIMPANINFRNIFTEKVEDVALVLLLPLFFVFTGLRTQIGLLNEPGLWQLCLIVVAVAVTGKFVGSALSARFVGRSWYESLTIGALMNTRGLMELVALNIGYDLGVLTPEMFAILVLMALFTTFMTGPLLDLFNRVFKARESRSTLLTKKDKYNVLISFGNPYTGKLLLRIAHMLTRKSSENSTVTALHLSLGNELNHFNSVEYERESFALLEEEGNKLRQRFTPIFKPTDDIDDDIVSVSNADDYDLLLVGVGQSVFEGTVLGRILGFTSKVINPERIYETLTGRDNLFSTGYFDERTKNLIKAVQIPLGILIDKGMDECRGVIVPIYSISDSFLLVYIQKFIQNGAVHITLLDANNVMKNTLEFREAVRAIDYAAPNHINLINEPEISAIRLESFDLMLVSLSTWAQLTQEKEEWLKDMPSTMVLKP